MPAKISINPGVTSLLIVEGTHDTYFFEALLDANGIIRDELQISDLGGKTLLLLNLKLLLNDPLYSKIKSIGIVRDADSIVASQSPSACMSGQPIQTAAQLAFSAVCGCLRNAALSVPTTHAVLSNGTPRIGVYVMPNGKSDGMLESLCRESVQRDPAAICVDGLFDCLQEGNSEMSISPKAWTHAFIATQSDPDLHLGKAAKKGYWNLRDSTFHDVIQFAKQLLDVDQIG